MIPAPQPRETGRASDLLALMAVSDGTNCHVVVVLRYMHLDLASSRGTRPVRVEGKSWWQCLVSPFAKRLVPVTTLVVGS